MAETKADAAAPAVHVEQHPHEELVWEPPGPGSWDLDKGHVPRSVTHFRHEVDIEPFRQGFAETFERYGIPAQGVQQALINGFSYTTVAPLPPDEFGSRMAAAERALAEKTWRDDLVRWDTEVKPASILRHRQLIEVDVDGIPTTALIAHLRECRDHTADMVRQHHQFNGAAMLPVGMLLNDVEDWTEGAVSAAEVLSLFAGASPVSRGECPELEAVRAALAGDERARSLVADRDADPAEVLDRLRSEDAVEPAVVAAVGEWLVLVGQRILDGFDVYQPRAIERPAVLVSCLRAAADPNRAAPPTPDVAAVRDRIPPEHHKGFDEALAEARLTYRLRDERGIYSDATATGITRRAMLAAGARLAAQGRLPSSELATEAGIDELVALLDEHPSAPTVDELRARARFRASHTADDAPPHLGEPPSPPPPYELLPPAVARVTRAIRAITGNMVAADDQAKAPPNTLTGVPASPGRHEGTARIVHTVDDLLRVEPGDVIVAITTAESFNLAMSFASAVVTDQGGLLGHAAITSREYGIPAVVGTHHATSAITDGMRIVVDGTTGEVSW